MGKASGVGSGKSRSRLVSGCLHARISVIRNTGVAIEIALIDPAKARDHCI